MSSIGASTATNSRLSRMVVSEPGRMAIVLAQMVVAVLLLRGFRLETEAFRNLAVLAVVAFPIHHWLPIRCRAPFFLLLGVGGMFIVVDWQTGAWVLVLGLVLIALCHLPLPYFARVGLVLAVAAVLAAGRAGWYETPWSAVVFTLLGSMFMFRLIVYLYDLKHSKRRPDPWKTLAYFFMFPNICFPLFPVVDYTTFVRTHYNKDAFEIYQTGIAWLFRGIYHLILYRIIYLYVAIDPADVSSAGSLLRFAVATYLLYLNISGIFHIIVGLLHLFGFNLPETHHRYLLASSFSDFWRRINIYWKDFILKVFFYPALFRLRRYGQTTAMVLATAFAFFATWVLHSYQWFWLRGSVLFTATDTLFWATLGTLVVVNTVIESRKAGRTSTARTHDALSTRLGLALRTVLTFVSIVLLWSLWTSESLGEWFALLRHATVVRAEDVLYVGAVLATIGAAAVLFGGARRLAPAPKVLTPAVVLRPAFARVAVAGVLLALCLHGLQTRLPGRLGEWAAVIEQPRLSDRDMARLQRGYYEDLTQVGRFSHQLAALYGKRPPDYFEPWRAAFSRPESSFLHYTLVPSFTYDYLGVRYTTNTWGMRDREYTREKPEGVYRIALLGASYAMGWGVNDGESFEALVEDRLNREGTAERAWEVLNFSIYGYGPIRKLFLLEERVLDFQPDAVIYECTPSEFEFMLRNFAHALKNRLPVPDPYLEDVLAAAGVDATADASVIEMRLKPYVRELTGWAFERFARTCREAGVRSVWMAVPQTADWYSADLPDLFELARGAGFDHIADLRTAFEGVPTAELMLYDWDYHPNVRGHRLLAGKLFEFLSTEFAEGVLVDRPIYRRLPAGGTSGP